MSWKNSFRAAMAPIVIAFGCTQGCSCSPPDCFGVHVGDRIAITIVDTYGGFPQDGPPLSYDAGPAGGCGFGFDLSQGQVLVATVANNVLSSGDNVCRGAIPEYEPFGGWTWALTGGNQSTGANLVLAGLYRATNGACIGQVQVSLQANHDVDPTTSEGAARVFEASVPGHTPNVILHRYFQGCEKSCGGTFVVNLKRL